MGDEFPKLKRPSLILVTGLAFTLVEEMVSPCIRGWAKCPWLKHEVVVDSLSEEAGYDIDNPPSEEEVARLLRLAFDITCSSACSLMTTPCRNEFVIISSSNLSYKSQLFRLMQIMQRHLSEDGSRLLIIDCLQKNKFIWQRFAELEYEKAGRVWYRPNRWEDVEEAIQHHQQEGVDAYFLTFFHPSPPPLVDAFKLVLDPFKDLFRDLDYNSESKFTVLNRRSLFIEAIKDLLTCDDVNTYGDGSHVVDYPEWRRQRLEEQGRSFTSRVTTQHHWCPRRGDCIFRLTHNPSHSRSQQQQEEEEVHCEICDGEIGRKEVAYYCQFCSLSFHQSCCSPSPTLNPEELSDLLGSIILKDDGAFQEIHACYSCIREGKGFSWSCDSCVYRTTLKSKLLSPVFTHSCDQHHILTMALSLDEESIQYICRACGRDGSRYSAYCCNICSSDAYHMECLHLPLNIMEHPHAGHLHQTNIEFSCPPKEDEYEWCLGCYKDIDPQTWVYRCQQCDYVAHLFCVFPFLSQRYHLPY